MMRVLTFGWDFPPQKNGGLGVACFGLTKGLTQDGVEVIFVLPKTQEVEGTPRFVFADVEKKVKVYHIASAIVPYAASDSRVEYRDEYGCMIHSRTLLQEVHRFAHSASAIARRETFDVIHAHDWTSYLAGVAAKIASGKPLILHVHATSFDQAAGQNVDSEILHIEKEAFAAADSVVTVSQFTKNILIERHGVSADKITVVHNGCDSFEVPEYTPVLQELKKQGKKLVLYHGRITVQKGIDYFVSAARRVIDVEPNVVFIISGWGDMSHQIMDQVGAMNLSKHFIFAGSLWEEERDQMYQSVDLVVMPSVSEPFGLVPLEAMQHGTPSLISKQSGVSEVVTHVLKVDFWDVEDMANKIVAALRYPVLHNQLKREGKRELIQISWQKAARKIKSLYKYLVQSLDREII